MQQEIFLPESASRADLRCPYNARVQSFALMFVPALEISNTESYTIVGHTKLLHTLIGMGSAAPATAVPYEGKATREVLKIQDK